MDMNKPCASLILRTVDATDSNNLKTSFVWSNINLRAVLGDMYDKHDNFNLVLVQVSSGITNSALGTEESDLCLYATIGGLPFLNQGYLNNRQTSDAILCPMNFTRSKALTYENMSVPFTFNKHQASANINIYYKKLNGDDEISSAEFYPYCLFVFKIYGI